MIGIAYTSPFVPVEWIAAHGLRPLRMTPRQTPRTWTGLQEGLCPFAQAFVAELAGGNSQAAIFTTTCDQMRRAPERLGGGNRLPVFLMNVPATWQTAPAARLYLGEIRRLGVFLQGLGGREPSREKLANAMFQYEAARNALLNIRPRLPARRFAELLCQLNQCGLDELPGFTNTLALGGPFLECGGFDAAFVLGENPKRRRSRRTPKGKPPAAVALETQMPPASRGLPIAVVGGPLGYEGLAVLDVIERAGGRVVLDATDGGQRSLPGAFDAPGARTDPVAELARAYFACIGDAFRRPNTLLYDWLAARLAEIDVRGIVLARHAWCDLWHVESARLRQWLPGPNGPLPLLDLDISGGPGAEVSMASRIQSFVEILQ